MQALTETGKKRVAGEKEKTKKEMWEITETPPMGGNTPKGMTETGSLPFRGGKRNEEGEKGNPLPEMQRSR